MTKNNKPKRKEPNFMKLDWSKLSEMPAFAPTGDGKYVMRCGGVVEIIKKNHEWTNNVSLCSWYENGTYLDNHTSHPFDIVAPTPDVLPWESEPEAYPGELESLRSDYKSLLEACEADRQARLKLEEECERLRSEVERLQTAMKLIKPLQEILKKNDPPCKAMFERLHELTAERDEWQRTAEARQAEIERLTLPAMELVREMLKDFPSEPPEPAEWTMSKGEPVAGPITVVNREIRAVPTIPEGFTPNESGMPPVDKDTMVEFLMRNGNKFTKPSGECRWNFNEWPTDIIAYRVITQPEPTPVFKAGDVVVVTCDTWDSGNKHGYKIGESVIVDDVSKIDVKVPGNAMFPDGVYLDFKSVRHATPAERAAFFAEHPERHLSGGMTFEEKREKDMQRILSACGVVDAKADVV